MSYATRCAETVRPPTPPTERVSNPDQPEASPVATEVVKIAATATTTEAAKIASTSTPQIGTSAAKHAPWAEHVSVFCRVFLLGLFVYSLCWFRVRAALLPQPGGIRQSICPG